MNDNKNNKNKKNGSNSSRLAIVMCIGISIGTAIGVATHNIGLWMPIGLSVGLCLGLVISNKHAPVWLPGLPANSDLSQLLLWQSQAALYEVACFLFGG